MPRKITAYACGFKCGRSCTTKEASIVAHEKNCFKNPKVKACRTCKHWDRDDDDSGETWTFCNVSELLNDVYAIRDCELHELAAEKGNE